jgi:hypothetical protein
MELINFPDHPDDDNTSILSEDAAVPAQATEDDTDTAVVVAKPDAIVSMLLAQQTPTQLQYYKVQRKQYCTNKRRRQKPRASFDVISSTSKRKRHKLAPKVEKKFVQPNTLPEDLFFACLLFLDLAGSGDGAAIACVSRTFNKALTSVLPMIPRVHFSEGIQKRLEYGFALFGNSYMAQLEHISPSVKRIAYCLLDEQRNFHSMPMMTEGGLLYLYGRSQSMIYSTDNYWRRRNVDSIVADLVRDCELLDILESRAKNLLVIVDGIRLREIFWPSWCDRIGDQDEELKFDNVTMVLLHTTQDPAYDLGQWPAAVNRVVFVGPPPVAHYLGLHRTWMRQSRARNPRLQIDVIHTHRTAYNSTTYSPVAVDWTVETG